MQAETTATAYPKSQKIKGKILVLMRTLTIVVMGVLSFVFINVVPATYQHMLDVCDPSTENCDWAQPTPDNVQLLNEWGIALEASAQYHIILYTLASLVMWCVAGLIFRYRSDEGFSYIVIFLFILLGTGGVSLVFMDNLQQTVLPEFLQIAAYFSVIPVYLLISIFLLTFPDGHFYPGRSKFVIGLILLNYLVWLVPEEMPLSISNWHPLLIGAWIVLVFGSHIAVQIIRYRHFYNLEKRQQTKWLIYGFSLSLVAIFLGGVGGVLFSGMLEGTLVSILYIPIPIAVGIAILGYRLWDIDIVIQRTLLYGLLSAFVVGVYAVVVSILGAIFQSSGSFVISLIATSIIAILFQPVRERLQYMVERLIYGERNNPYAVISRLSERMEANIAPNTLLPGIAETVAQALKLPYVAIRLKQGEDYKTDAVFGQPADRGHITSLPLLYGQEIVGEMVIGQVAGDKELQGQERELLENIARQTGIAVHAVQLNAALQQSRQHIITAREEERRRIRRDLHDGLGPALAAHTIQIGTARALVNSKPETATAILEELENNLASSLSDIRRLVYNLRPPVLDQLGLVVALREFVEQCNQLDDKSKTRFELLMSSEFPPLPAAVEVAAYRIVQEAVNNVIRHARAKHATIELKTSSRDLTIMIRDDGIGMPSDMVYGVGLNSMRERAEELGGSLTIHTESSKGIQIVAQLPNA